MHVEVSNAPSDDDRPYDLVVGSLGYEERCSFVPLKLRHRTKASVAIAFPGTKVHSYGANERLFLASHIAIRDERGTGFAPVLKDTLEALKGLSGQPRLAIDISSMNRSRLALAVQEVWEFATLCPSGILVDFWYTPAVYLSPHGYDEVMQAPGPVSPFFRGRVSSPGTPFSLILGLGYEPNRGLGAIELLEPDRTVAFSPRGHDSRYEEAIRRVNGELLKSVGEDAIVEYPVSDPGELFHRLESTSFSLAAGGRLGIVPLGPKIFALAAMVVSLLHEGAHAVWRVSPGDWGRPRDVRSSEVVSGLRLAFRPNKLP